MIYNPHLDGNPFYWEAGPTGILLIHGFTATVAEVRPLAKTLHAAGYTVSAPLLPGHYTDPRDLNKVHWQDWVQAMEEAFLVISSKCERVIVGGESTGALISLYLGIRHPEISALLLYAPALQLNIGILNRIQLHLIAPFIPSLPKADLGDDPLWQGYFVNPPKGVIQLLRLQQVVKPDLGQIKQPVLIVQGKLDMTVHSGVPDMIYNQIKSNTKEIVWMEKSAHCVIIDQEKELVDQITLEFLEKILKKPSAGY